MYTDIEKQLNAIEDKMYAKLKETKAIDANNNVTDQAMFSKIVREGIAEMEKLTDQVEKDGFVHDRYGFNILQARLDFWNQKSSSGRLIEEYTPNDQEAKMLERSAKRKETIEQTKPKAFAAALKIKKLFKRANPKNTPQPVPEMQR
ncbi:MAG: hypothetical protein MJ165_02390 [Alphaproteobacteria bacterium]|nr:hypothetical protein [Alphaproteobacteria bacterium]